MSIFFDKIIFARSGKLFLSTIFLSTIKEHGPDYTPPGDFIDEKTYEINFQNNRGSCLLGIHSCLKAQSMPSAETAGNTTHTINIEFNKNIEFLGYALYIGEPAAEPLQPSTHPLRLLLDEKRMNLNGQESLLKMFQLGADLDYSLFVELFARMDELPYSDEFKIPGDCGFCQF